MSTSEHVEWALSKLGRRQRLFLQAFMQVVEESENPTWEEICERAGVVSEKNYLTKLTQLGLLLNSPDGKVFANSVLTSEMVGVAENVRKVSNSLRFEVFQRDQHTCQYCGRCAPEIELEVDHLTPVARGGTDDFENLVSSCRECNSGKSARLIKQFTEGYTKESWRKEIRKKRVEQLRERRLEVDNVISYWAECKNRPAVSQYELEAIYRFAETYEPEWIKAAIRIATRQQRRNYVKYVAAVLKNWAQSGPPEYVANPEGALEAALDQKKATDRQINYISRLLERLGLSLSECYHKNDYKTLTQLDARNLFARAARGLELYAVIKA